jgi:hypothetical protein
MSATAMCAALVLLAAAAGGAYAATSGGGAIHACAKKLGGALRLAAHCKHTERSVTWGITGPPGAAGTARGYASVTRGSSPGFIPVFESPPKGFASVSRPTSAPTGVYCLTPAAGSGIDPGHPNAVVSPEWSDSTGNDLLAFAVNDGVKSCPTGTIEVHTYAFGTNPADPPPSNNVAFTIIVP